MSEIIIVAIVAVVGLSYILQSAAFEPEEIQKEIVQGARTDAQSKAA